MLQEHGMKSVTAQLGFYSPQGLPGKKDTIYLGTASDKLRKAEYQATSVTSVKPGNDGFKFDKHGFQYLVEPTSLTPEEFADSAFVKSHYYPEAADMIKCVTGASHVVCENHLIRKNKWEAAQDEAERVSQQKGEKGMCHLMHPARGAHVDQSYLGAEQTLQLRFGDDEAQRLMKKRWAVINVWRPLRTIRRDPLAVCDWRTVSEADDLCPVDLVMPSPAEQWDFGRPWMDQSKQNVIERWDVTFNPKQKWYYRPNMQPDECLLIKIFDSKTDGRARCCPHTSFETEQDEGPARESVELRTLVFWDD